MKHTPEQLAGMVDAELNNILKQKLFGYGWHTERALSKINYCIDWAATGPLMVEYNVWPIEDGCHNYVAVSCPLLGMGYDLTFDEITFSTVGPLRAVVECLILVLQECE